MKGAPSLIEVLNKVAPDEIRRLRVDHGSAGQILTTRRELGDKSPKASSVSDRSTIIDLIKTSISPLTIEFDRISEAIRGKMRQVAAIRFTGAIVATVAGGLTGFIALAAPNQVVQAVTSFVGMFGGAATMVADQFERAPSGLRIASSEEYGKLLELRAGLELIRIKVERDGVNPLSASELAAMLDQLDQASLQILRLRLA